MDVITMLAALVAAVLSAVLVVLVLRGKSHAAGCSGGAGVSDGVSKDIRHLAELQDTRLANLDKVLDRQTQGLEAVRLAVNTQLIAMREDNNRQLEAMRNTVDQKLTETLDRRLTASFSQVSRQLEQVYKGLGNVQSIASDVGDLKHILANVKTRGILGEVQLGAILSDILAPSQYLENVATRPGSSERVEFAVKLPTEEGAPILLPIDAKFPGDAYAQLINARHDGNKTVIAAAERRLEVRLKLEAKDISGKYLCPPHTTNFALLFLPFEGLYAEVVSRPGLIEALQRDYRVSVAGPSTMAAILNSLQMSYQTFHLQKKTDEVLKVLAAVKAEFPKYQRELEKAYKQLGTARGTVEKIMTTRTRAIQKKFGAISALEDDAEAERLLGFSEYDYLDGLPEGDE